MDKIFCVAMIILLIAIISNVAKKIKMPKWSKKNHHNSWGIVFFDSKPWLKIMLIKLMQIFVVICLLAIILCKISFGFASKMLSIKKIKI